MSFFDSLGSNPDFWQAADDIYQSSGMNQFYGQSSALSAKKDASIAARYPGANNPSAIINAVIAHDRDISTSGKGTFFDEVRKAKAPAGPSFYELTRDRPGSSQPQIYDYLDAPWASAYGMSKETAYSEAMENTAYRRSVSDMQKAGLNPAVIFGAGRGSTAGSPSYISSGSSGSSGRVSRRGSGSGRSNGKLFSGSAYSVLSALGGIVGAAATKSAGGYWLGTSLAQGAMSALNLFNKR